MIYRDQLQAVRKLIEAPERWTQDTYALTSGRCPVDPNDPAAVCWCLRGALLKVMGGPKESFCKALGLVSVVLFNDAPERTHAEVLALLDAAIERAPVREAQS